MHSSSPIASRMCSHTYYFPLSFTLCSLWFFFLRFFHSLGLIRMEFLLCLFYTNRSAKRVSFSTRHDRERDKRHRLRENGKSWQGHEANDTSELLTHSFLADWHGTLVHQTLREVTQSFSDVTPPREAFASIFQPPSPKLWTSFAASTWHSFARASITYTNYKTTRNSAFPSWFRGCSFYCVPR